MSARRRAASRTRHPGDTPGDHRSGGDATAGRTAEGSDVDVARVRAVLALGGVPWGDLEDGVQEVRLRLLQQQADPNRAAVRNPSAWSSVVAARVAADWHRAGARDQGLHTRLAARWARQATAGHSDEDRALALAVADGLSSLPRHQRQILSLRYYEDLSVNDIAELLELPGGTVKSRLHHAVAALRDRLRRTEVIPDDRTDRG
ncbi:sigma-70 family RNA polymerase sigma factor [Streptomyces aculeolatus]|uniref:RNA polymerase sigma factor n=1 Tax=Streptomyces aculeolatus TaxID=270689 RepID=UPI001CEE01B5|nr:sigma-70 family RNA polymerase sigma factor [Streptomyces aculeolatus]